MLEHCNHPYHISIRPQEIHRKPTLLFLLTILMLILTIMPVSAQQSRKVTGMVTNLQSQPIPGASIVLKGTFIGTSTDADGKFTIDVSGQDAILVVSFLGYAPQEVAVGSQNVINVNLVEDVKSLSEVVVVGYGTQRKKDVTGAVAVL